MLLAKIHATLLAIPSLPKKSALRHVVDFLRNKHGIVLNKNNFEEVPGMYAAAKVSSIFANQLIDYSPDKDDADESNHKN